MCAALIRSRPRKFGCACPQGCAASGSGDLRRIDQDTSRARHRAGGGTRRVDQEVSVTRNRPGSTWGFDLVEDPYLFHPPTTTVDPTNPTRSRVTFRGLSAPFGPGFDFHLHQLRHFSATQLISSGHDVATVSKRLGHSTAAVTLDIYTHALRQADREAAEHLGTVVSMPQFDLGEITASH